MASVVEQRDQHYPEEHLEIAFPPTRGALQGARSTIYSNRHVSVQRVCSLSGIALTGVIALLGWALYARSPSQDDFRPLQETAAQETLLAAATPAMLATNDAADGFPARPVDVSFASVPAMAAKEPNEPPAQIYLHIQSPAQRKIAQRLVEQLQEKGYVIPKAAILEPKGPPRTEVRYFSPTEAEEATAIAMLVNQPYRVPATSSYIRGRKDAAKPQPRRYEVWLGPEPRPPRTRQ